jgi:hypothetical protein
MMPTNLQIGCVLEFTLAENVKREVYLACTLVVPRSAYS